MYHVYIYVLYSERTLTTHTIDDVSSDRKSSLPSTTARLSAPDAPNRAAASPPIGTCGLKGRDYGRL